MIKNKKAALSPETLVAFIIIIAGAIILFLYFQRLMDMNPEAERAPCRTSVLEQSIAIYFSNDLINVQCPAYQIKFFEKRVEKNGKAIPIFDEDKEKEVKRFKSLDNDTVNEVIAEELRWCWYQFLEGKKTIFDMVNTFGNIKDGFIREDKRLCYVCDEIVFDKSVKREMFGGFYNYTKETIMPNSEMTYYQYYAEEPRISLHTKDEKIQIFKDRVIPFLYTSWSDVKNWPKRTLRFLKLASGPIGIIDQINEAQVEKQILELNSWESYYLFFIMQKLPKKDFPYLSQSPEINFHKDKTYAVTFIRRGYTSRAEKGGMDLVTGIFAHTES